MRRLTTDERTGPVVFESLEARLLLAAAPLVQPDGPMPQAAGPGCGPPVEQTSQAADVDGDGKLGLNDVKTNAAGEPTSLTFNGRGIDLNEDAKIDALAAASVGVHRPDSTDIDMLLIGKVLSDSAEAQAARDGKITPWERVQLCSLQEPPVTSACGFSGAQAFLRGRVVDLAFWGADRTISAASYDFGTNGSEAAGSSRHRPFVVGYFEDWHYSAGRGAVEPGAAMTVHLASRPIIEDILGSIEDFETAEGAQASAAFQAPAGHCKIMAVRVANPEGSDAAGGPLGALMGGIGSILGGGS